MYNDPHQNDIIFIDLDNENQIIKNSTGIELNPKQYFKDKGTAYTEILKNAAPGDRSDFIMLNRRN